jgi:uncharacterized membrane protein
MKSAKQYRIEAQSNCSRYTKTLIFIALITLVISLVLGFTIQEEMNVDGVIVYVSRQPLAFLSILVTGPLAVGWASVSKTVYNQGDLSVGDVFNGFKKNYFKNAWAYILQSIYLALWAIISLGIVAVVKSFSYSMTYYILEENPELSANEAITQSRKMMKGRKWKLFCLSLSYFGWILLSVLTLGILFLWVGPRMEQAFYSFYLDCKSEN